MCREPTAVTESTYEPFVLSLEPRVEHLRSIVEPVVVDEGFELVWLAWVSGAQRSVIRLFLDTVDPATHIELGDLERLNRLIGDVLDVEDQHSGLFRGQYVLEVSSPGVDRPLAKRSHFVQARGQRVKVRARVRIGQGGRGHTGHLFDADDTGILLSRDDVPEEHVRVAWGDLDDAHVVFEFASPAAPRPRREKKGGRKASGEGSERMEAQVASGAPPEPEAP